MAAGHLLVFGDQALKTHLDIKALARQARSSLLLRTFLQKTTDALRSHIRNLPPCERRTILPFSSILELAEAHTRNGVNNVVVSTILLCVVQLGSLILHAENNPITYGSSKVCVVGLSTGLLPASAAAAAAGSASELLKVAPEIVCISLRLALEAQRRSDEIEQSQESWAVLVTGIPAAKQLSAIEKFHETHILSPPKKAYISEESDLSTTISGPPSILASLFTSSETLSSATKVRLPISAAFHASHLRKVNVDKILGSSSMLNTGLMKNVQVISTGSGKPFVADSLRSLLELAIDDILQSPLYWSKIIPTVVSIYRQSEIVLTAIGPTNVTKSLRGTLEKESIKVTETRVLSESSADNLDEDSEDVAIIGMACRYPGCETLEEFWDVLERGQDLHTKIPKDRFPVESHCDSSGTVKNASLTPYGCFMERPGAFDARLFNMSPREAAQTDPTQRLILMTTYEALEMAGYGEETAKDRRIGTFFGQTTDDWREFNAAQNIDLYYVTGGLRPFGPGRLNYHFKWEGPSYSVDTTCSSSSAAIQMACTALLSRDCDMVVAGGGNLLTGSDMFAGLSRGTFLSLTGSCKTFDDEADGYCRGEGVGSVVMKRLKDAIADRDNILGVIKSVATNHSAHAISITHPHAGAQIRLYERVLREACVEPDEVGYIEMHGTGTQAGDLTEVESSTSVFGQGRLADNSLYIGSAKPNFGHGEAAAGITSLIKAILMLRKSVIPPHVGIKGRINHKFPDLNAMNIQIARGLVDFKAPQQGNRKKKILINNFGATGGNTSILVEEPSPQIVCEDDPRTAFPVVLSGRVSFSLQHNKQRLLNYLIGKPQTKLASLSYTTTARRTHHVFRTAYAADTTLDLIEIMKKDLESSSEPNRVNDVPPIIFVFTGQGSQHPGMGKLLFKSCASFRNNILNLERICLQQGLPSFINMIIDSDLNITRTSTVQAHLALISLELALANLWESWGLKPSAVIGHSLGEYAALCVAGVISVSDMLFLVAKRAELIQEHCTPYTHTMLAIQRPAEHVQQYLTTGIACEIACLNGPNSVVISGTAEAVKSLDAQLQAKSIKTHLLKIPFAFHSPQMDPILKDFEILAENVQFSKPKVPVASTLLGVLVTDEGTFTPHYLTRQTRMKVDFIGALKACQSAGLMNKDRTLWVENGPAPTCLGLVRASFGIPDTKTALSMKPNGDSWKLIARGLANAYNGGVNVHWHNYHKDFEKALSLLCLPTYAFDLKNYWIQYEGDWALKKNDQTVVNPSAVFSTTCLQAVKSERYDGGEVSVTFLSDAAEPNLFAAIQGHLVDGVGLCPSSVYADMAFTAASYVQSKMKSLGPALAMDVTNMEVFHPLVVVPDTVGQLIKVSATKAAGADAIEIRYSSQDGPDSEFQEHAQCIVRFGDADQWKAEWARYAYLIKGRIDCLVDPGQTRSTHRILKEMVYKLFSVLVVYDEKYQGLKEVYMNSNLHEAFASVRFEESIAYGDFTYSPYWLDTMAHLAGFVLNGSVKAFEDVVYISHGWKSMRIAGTILPSRAYTSYVRMQTVGDRGVMVGDVYIFDGEEIIAVCAGLKFQRLKRTVLRALLSKDIMSPVRSDKVQLVTRSAASTSLPPRAKNAPTESFSDSDKKTPTTDTSSITFSNIMDIVAHEIKIDSSELTGSANFTELGVDSLLTISIMSTIQHQTGLMLPASVFSLYPTVTEFADFFQEQYGDLASDDNSSEPSTPHRSDSSVSSNDSIRMADVFTTAVASETGTDPSELEGSTLFADLGVDSLMSIAILSAVKEKTGLMLPASLFTDYPTVAQLRKALALPSAEHIFALAPKQNKLPPRYSSKTIFLQGRPNSKLPALFLIADGAGSAASYLNLPTFSTGLPVYALESPFLHCPTEYNISFEAVASIYVEEIRKTQPRGPYILGGWSLGGMHAYEVARQLIATGEKVKGIVMIDSPCPKALPHMPDPTLELMEQTGVFIGITRAGKVYPMPLKTKQHLLSCVKALKVYEPIPIPADQRPGGAFVMWAKDGVFEKLSDSVEAARTADNEETSTKPDGLRKDWLTAQRKSFGPNGWDRLLGNIECIAVEGDHFSVMNPPRIKLTGQLIDKALEKFLK